MDRQVYWNDFLLTPVESQSLEDYLLSPNGINPSYANATSQENASLSIWNSGAPSSSEHPQNQGNRDETKMENLWATSLAGNGGGGLRIDERRSEAVNLLSLGNVDINLNSHHVDNSQQFSPSSIDLSQNFGHDVGHVGTSSQTPGLLESEHIPSSDGSSSTLGNSSRGVGTLLEDVEDRPGSSLDGRRACKRKNIEGVPEQESASGSSRYFRQNGNSSMHSVSSHRPSTNLNISRSSDLISALNPVAQLNSRIGSAAVVASDSSSGSVLGNAESSQRNVRMRTNPARQYDTIHPNLWTQGNATTLSNVWSTDQSSLPIPIPFPIPFQSLQSRTVVSGASTQSALQIPVIPRLPPNVQPWNGATGIRIGSSPSNPIIVGERLMVPSEETNSRSIPRSNSSDPSVFVPATDTRQLAAVPPNWVSPDASASIPGSVPSASRAGTSSGFHHSFGHQIPQYQRSISEALHRSLFSAGSAAHQGANVAPQRAVQSATSQEIRVGGMGLRSHSHPYMRSPIIMDRQRDGTPGIPVSMRTLASGREGRRVISEHIRNVLDIMRRDGNLRLEDFVFDQAFFLGGADMLDRHRDMRLDVDNMSYEELLALEERIGNVSTGLSEETVLMHLKQRKYASVTVEASAEVEPCCICQEEYSDHVELGILDCGHDFHTACIKQWLMQKNLCPICKTTALAAAGK